MLPNNWNDLLGHENEQNSRGKGEEKVMYLEEAVGVLRRVVLHQGLNGKDGGEVRDERGGDRGPGRERCDTRLPAHIRLRHPVEDGREDCQQGVGDLKHFDSWQGERRRPIVGDLYQGREEESASVNTRPPGLWVVAVNLG